MAMEPMEKLVAKWDAAGRHKDAQILRGAIKDYPDVFAAVQESTPGFSAEHQCQLAVDVCLRVAGN